MLTLALLAQPAGAALKAAPNVPPVEDETPAPPPAAPQTVHPARQAIIAHPIHDPTNPDYARLQRQDEATRDLPHDASGFPDWMRALREGRITPRADLTGTDSMQPLDLDIVMRNTREMPWVRFPHRSHTLWLDCANCHPEPFVAQAGANRISMSGIFRGTHCGMCHDRVAFITFFSCERCHSVPQTRPAGARP